LAVAADVADAETAGRKNFIKNIVEDDLASGKHKMVVTRFPPEPNGESNFTMFEI
jgi:glutaminyl-tRNA synthetase